MNLYKLETGNFMLDGGAMFGVVPKSLWQQVYPANERNLCKLALRCLLVETADRLLLIDTGIGNKQSERFFSHYCLNGEASLEQSLGESGFSPRDITDVLLTHLHFDHAGGAVYREAGSGALKPFFPQADYWVSRRQWEWARQPNQREKASYLAENIVPLEQAGVLRFIEQEGEFLPGLALRLFQGHTDGLMIPVITREGKTLVFAGDLIPTAAHIPASWVCGYDTRPLISFAEREAFLQEAYAGGYTLFFEHDIRVECCRLTPAKKGYQAGETFSFAAFLSA